MKVTFVLPGAGYKPVGGFKVVYEYANRLTERGHRVFVIHTANPWVESSSSEKIRNFGKFTAFALGANGGFKPKNWFKVAPKVDMRWVPTLAERYIPDSDAIIATSWQTAECVARYGNSKGKQFNLIQHQESIFDGVDAERVMETWKLPPHKIVIAKWLSDIASEMGETSTYIPNGLDFEAFGLDTPIENRDAFRLMMMYHEFSWKGSSEGIEAMRIAQKECLGLKVDLFGVAPKPQNLPEWVNYHQMPGQSKLRELYNKAAIFISPSWAEGWGLPPAEAMQCGAVVCATDVGGHREFCIDGETALMSPAKDSAALAENIMRILKDRDLRVRIALQGNANIQQFTWEKAVDSLERCFQEAR